MKIYNYLTKLSYAAAFTLVLGACSDDDDTSQYYQENLRDITVAQYIQNGANTEAGSYNTLNAAIEKAGLRATLESGNITLFAPTDAAFAAAGIDIRDVDASTLADILSYHVIDSEVESDALGNELTTVQGTDIIVNGLCLNGNVGIASAGSDINVNNGVIHSVDNVLMPPSGNLVSVIGDFASATDAELTLLQNAVVKAGLDATLAGSSKFTLLAPTDAAMTAAGFDQAGIDAATAQELEDFLLFHVIPGGSLACGLTEAFEALDPSNFRTDVFLRTETAAGPLSTTKGVDISIGDDGLEIEGAVVENSDIIASNGVIHIVDAVVTPKPTIAEALNEPNIGLFQYYRTHRFSEILDKSGVTYDLNGSVILYVPSTFAVDTYLDNLGTDVATLSVTEAADLVNFHEFNLLFSELVSETYINNADTTGTFLYNSNSGGDYLNLLTNGFVGFSTLDESFILDTDRSGLGFGFLAGASWQDERLYNGYVTTSTSVLADVSSNSILDELVADGNYTTLVAALEETGLDELVDEGNVILFAPTDAAFSAIG
ncbi:fasciclin domain-containing protein, partial [Fulvivirga sp. RKSG066]|uniref:fasciclin domain-containing protein n=1 Tax=Fulvivirga aurantia TaxID=2529383 RepID=UPI0012BD3E38